MPQPTESFWKKIIYIVSIAVSSIVVFLILGPRPEGTEVALDVSVLPLVNAILNSITTGLLLTGFIYKQKGRILQHKQIMLGAFGTSTLFLLSYVVYHWFKTGPKEYLGDWVGVYYTILISHILLAIVILPLALFTLYRGWNMQVLRHKLLAKITLPLWLYVSITGIIIYGMLYL